MKQPLKCNPSKKRRPFNGVLKTIRAAFNFKWYFAKYPGSVPNHAIILFPCLDNMLGCGLACIVHVKNAPEPASPFHLPPFTEQMARMLQNGYMECTSGNHLVAECYLGDEDTVDSLSDNIKSLKKIEAFSALFNDAALQDQIKECLSGLYEIVKRETGYFHQHMGRLPADAVETMSRRLEKLQDAAWCLNNDIIQNISRIKSLTPLSDAPVSISALTTLKNINAALNSMDRLEVRGRDSAGVSLLFVVDAETFENFLKILDAGGHLNDYQERLNQDVLLNKTISLHTLPDNDATRQAAIAFTYKVAAEIGRLGDNIRFIRRQIQTDPVIQALMPLPHCHHTVSAHTRWASVGEISEANCHPVDNRTLPTSEAPDSIIHVCLNGDIDNFQELKQTYERQKIFLPPEITCDTKIIPVHIAAYLKKGFPVAEAFRLAVNDFEGSHAITMHTDLAPGKLFLCLKGSGQALFVGLAPDHYISTSELYGLVEETSDFIKLDGEILNPNPVGTPVNGQIVILDQASKGGMDGITAMSYDGTPIPVPPEKVRRTPLTSRDIDRQDFDHYFLKEISESPASVRKTLENRWKIEGDSEQKLVISLSNTQVPENIVSGFHKERFKRIIFIGQGTAGVAAQVCADILRYYLKETNIRVESYKSSEMSGFILQEQAAGEWRDTLLVPISQSGTTADTNRAVDMMKKQGARAIAIVNRRDSDLSFKTDGVLYTSSGRDIEMSVASTKAFYSQIIAGSILGLYLAQITKCRESSFISNQIKQMINLPALMEQVLSLKDQIRASARRHANSRTYWAAVGSGPNKAAADEIRIKLSELCYKTISSDFVEDKKHIDLSSEPLIFVCAAGTRRNVLGDIVKDTAIFHSHKALTIVIADEHEDRFDPYASEVIYVPSADEHLAPILNTLAGHLWGYYAALAINEGSKFLFDFREDLQAAINAYTLENLDIYEIALEKSFREKIIRFYHDFRKQQAENRLSSTIGIKTTSDLILLLKYLGGKLPLTDFEMDFGIKGTAGNMFNQLFAVLGTAINTLARPVDAIKHQAKTVTVGTSRIEEKAEGLIFDLMADKGFILAQLTISNIMVLKNLQPVIQGINGSTLYRISGIALLGDPDDDTTIELIEKKGTSAKMTSRAEQDKQLTGTKKIIVQRGNVYIGKGRKDDRSILVIPLLSKDAGRPNTIEFLLLLDIAFQPDAALNSRIKALGGKYEHIKNLVQENNIAWKDEHLERLDMPDLFGWSAEKVAETVIANLSSGN